MELPIEYEVDVVNCFEILLVSTIVLVQFEKERSLNDVAEGGRRDCIEYRMIQSDSTHYKIKLRIGCLNEEL